MRKCWVLLVAVFFCVSLNFIVSADEVSQIDDISIGPENVGNSVYLSKNASRVADKELLSVDGLEEIALISRNRFDSNPEN